MPLLNQEEFKLLSIRQGSLDDDERQQIEAHVVHTVSFLQAIPWTSELRNIPEIARAHHEKLNGQGLSVQAFSAGNPGASPHDDHR